MADLAQLEAMVAGLYLKASKWKWSPGYPATQLQAEILEGLQPLIDAYAIATEEEREAIRELMNRYPGIKAYLSRYIKGPSSRLGATIAPMTPENLRRALLAVAIDNDNFGDYRDVLTMLGNLWLAAARAGIDPRPFFTEAAAKSGTQVHLQGGLSTREILERFDRSHHFRADVEPQLPKQGQ